MTFFHSSFHNRTVNLLNLHTGISMAALGGGGAFVSVCLLQAGIAIPLVMLAFAAIFALRFAVRPFVVGIAARYGLKRLFILGAAGLALQFPLVAEVHGVNAAFFWLIAVSATVDTVYWPVYHAYFASVGDAEHRGQQLGIREAISASVGIISPLTAGWLLVDFGPRIAFAVTAAVQVLSAAPLLWVPDVVVVRHAPGAYRAAVRGALLFMADGWTAGGYVIAWQFALFMVLGKNYLAYGGALALSALVGAVGGMALGRVIDAGKGGRAVWIALAIFAGLIVLRASVQDHPALAVAANALGSLGGCLYIPTLMTAVYNQAKRAPCTLRFQVAAEGGWDIGIAASCLLSALLTWLALPLSLAILSALLGAATVFVLLRRYYAEHPSDAIDASLRAAELEVHASEVPKI